MVPLPHHGGSWIVAFLRRLAAAAGSFRCSCKPSGEAAVPLNSQLLDINMWANYNDLTATSLESWKIRRIIPRLPYFWLVNYCNLPGYLSGCIQESIDTL